mmetsp:Transcript_2699/g.7712  ORF Transcript_2699/g.7712 Transcript_2699/m.7712 type:complete len:268 (-) Transcript_2699:1208-2011(-)
MSKSQLRNEGHASVHPVGLFLVRGNLDGHHIVRRVARRAEDTKARHRLVDWRGVDASGGLCPVRGGLQIHYRHGGVELLWPCLVQKLCCRVPGSALYEEPVDIDAHFRGCCEFSMWPIHDAVAPRDGVDWQLVHACIVLQRAREEGLREEEARDPEGGGLAVVEPVLNEVRALLQVVDPGGEGLEARVRFGRPHGGDLVVEEGSAHGLELLRHDHLSTDGLLDGDEGSVDLFEELVVADNLLLQYRVHGLLVARGVVDHSRLVVKLG